jgi:predicted dehydrogenase
MPGRSPLKIGFIGGGLDSAVGYAHFVSCRMDNKWEVVSGCFSDKASINIETAKKYGVLPKRVYLRWEDMIKKEKGLVDAIVIITPTPTHYKIVMACLKENIPVICEKSLAETSSDADKIIKMVKKQNCFLAVTYNYSGYPMVRELRNIIKEGSLGKLLHLQIEMPQEGYLRVDKKGNKLIPQKWRMNDKSIPMLHLDLATHMHQLVDYVTGFPPLKVISVQESYGNCKGVIDNVMCLCEHKKGVRSQIWFSKSALGYRNGLKIRIFGSDASAEWLQGNPEELIISHKDGRREIVDRASQTKIANIPRYNRFKAGHPAGYIEAFANYYSDIADSLDDYKSSGRWASKDVFGADMARDGLRFIEAMVRSSKKKAWQKVAH